MLPVINAVWIGRTLGPIHAACLASFVQIGHPVRLHAFDDITDVPKGVDIFDATQLMTRSEIIAHESGSLALASDIYRYRILREEMGIYVDCDIYCLKPFPKDDYLFGWETNISIASGVLNIPKDSELLKQLIAGAEDRYFIAPWFSGGRRRKLKLLTALGRGVPLERQRWGTIGPALLTYHAKRLGLDQIAKPIDCFYNLQLTQSTLLNSPAFKMSDCISSRSLAVHLWASDMQKDIDILPDTILAGIASSNPSKTA